MPFCSASFRMQSKVFHYKKITNYHLMIISINYRKVFRTGPAKLIVIVLVQVVSILEPDEINSVTQQT